MSKNEIDFEELKSRIIRIQETNSINIDIEYLKKVYLKDVTKLLRQLERSNYENKRKSDAIAGAHNANDRMQNKKYRMINLLTTIDSVLPEPGNPDELPDDYQFDITIKWGLIKAIRNMIKGT